MKPGIWYHKDKEIVCDCIRNRHVIVFDVNLSNTNEHDLVSRRVKHQYPVFFEVLQQRIMAGDIHPGSCMIMDIDGMTLVGLVTHIKPYDREFDDRVTVEYNTIKAITEMLTRMDVGREYVSSILGRKYGVWQNVSAHIRNLKLHWSIYPE